MTASLAQTIVHARNDAKRRAKPRSTERRFEHPPPCPFRMTKQQFDESAARLHHQPLLEFEDRGDMTVVTFRRKQLFTDEWQVMCVRDELRRLIADTGRRKFVFNFAKTEYINGAGLGMMIGICRSVTNVWGRMVLCDVGDGIIDLFHVTKLTRIFHIEANEDDAMAWLEMKGLLSRDNESPLGME